MLAVTHQHTFSGESPTRRSRSRNGKVRILDREPVQMKAVLCSLRKILYGPRFWVPFFSKLKQETGAKVYCLAPSYAHINDYRQTP